MPKEGSMTDEQIKTEMVKKLSTMTTDQIADLFLVVINEGVERGMNAGINATKQKFTDNIQKWANDEIIKTFMRN